ncbi:MAG: 1,4-alpha-glucan branching protein GlgB [Verrucomicrobiae bacterium]|nr:1,4-alpha-glucan branching protein GlgB [Verrucomicrobiae bacterium]
MKKQNTWLSQEDIHFFNEGTHLRLYDKLGCHLTTQSRKKGAHFSVWAPNAEKVFCIGDFNDWDRAANSMEATGHSGVWEGFIPGVKKGDRYKYYIVSRHRGYCAEKLDPIGFCHETPPRTASVAWDLDYEWQDADWLAERKKQNFSRDAMSIYELHLGSWRRIPEEGHRFLTYRELAPLLVDYVKEMGFTHVEFLPIMEHPFYGSWGYQVTGYFAPTSRFGTPQDFMFLIDCLHQHGIGVILDWVPSHFPNDAHGLAFFDGSHLYEHADPRQGFHPDWKSGVFNYGRHEVKSFLLSSALFWLDKYHIDGIRVDAVASMLYLDYSRKAGEWIPNCYGSNENLDAIALLKQFNQSVRHYFPDTITMAEESTAWPAVSRPVEQGGLGFHMKWDMGWMHDTLYYFRKNPIFRKFHQGSLTFRMVYAFNENFVLPLSHDEVVHEKGSLLEIMPGDEWEKFANLRLLLGYMYAQSGKKLLFMGGEFAQGREWSHEGSLDWHLLENGLHAGVQRWVRDLNRLYRQEPALHEKDFDSSGFEWVDFNDADSSVVSFLRRGETAQDLILVVCHATPAVREDYRVGVPEAGFWKEILNSDAREYVGSGRGNWGGKYAEKVPAQRRNFSLNLTLPPLSISFFKLLS